MPRGKPSSSGYERIVEAEEQEDYLDNSDDDDLHLSQTTLSATDSHYAPIQPGPHQRMQSYHSTAGNSPTISRRSRGQWRKRSNSTVDIKAINARLERWAEEIASKFKLRKIKGKSPEEEKLEIHYSVFQAPEDIRAANADILAERFTDQADKRMNKIQFDDVVESVKVAIELGTQPKMITQGSSGSYFARNSDGKVVGVFKPKDEEPYASRNPKWTKWIHRNLFPFFFGRACLIPNLSYISEAAAYVLDTRLQTNLVPYTDIVYLSSISFNYDLWDRRAYYRKRKALPQKVGSFQVFLKGFKDANIFLKEHPWPDQSTSNLQAKSVNKRSMRRWANDCRPGGTASEDDDDEGDSAPGGNESRRRKVFWTDTLQQSFREQLEKLVILDYIMRNTDRGLDNWMIRIDEETEQATIVADAPQAQHDDPSGAHNESDPYKREGPMTTSGSNTPTPSVSSPKVMVGAIDNSLSWPWKHPDAWRSFPFGWLFLPVSLIGQPFSERTRQHFLPLLTSKQWWSETQIALRNCFSQDSDFQERMYARQIAVMKGQAWNVVETLKTPDHGPLELTRRSRVCVWDDLVDIPVIVPLRVPSNEMRRKHEASAFRDMQDEGIDISAARSSAPQPPHAVLDLSSPPGDLPKPNRFNISRQDSSEDTRRHSVDSDATLQLGAEGQGAPRSSISKRDGSTRFNQKQRDPQRSQTRLSLDEPRYRWLSEERRKRTLSWSARRMHEMDESDGEGDLGFAAASDMEGNRKKVIVERLETVKSKNPVFTWC